MPITPDSARQAEIAQLDDLRLNELRAVWRERLGTPPRVASTELTRRWLSWELQARAQGGLDAATRRRLRQLGKTFRTDPAPAVAHRALRPGTVLTREWNGATHRVMVLEGGFAWNGQQYASLSEVASRITGARWSGPRFFGLRQQDAS
jgi:hypothetical protein